jgi:integrase
MSSRRKSIPSYLPHDKHATRARAVWTDSSGNRRFKILPGAFESDESRTAFARLMLELQAAPHHAQATDPNGITLVELLFAFLEHAERHYRLPDGELTSEIYEVRVVVRALRELYADKPVAEFGPLCVKAAQQRWVNDGCSRTECNRRVGMVKRILKWAVSEELAPPAVYQAVATVPGLQKGRTAARETKPVGPVDDATVDATLPFLHRHLRGLIEFQRLTGSRPGEACRVRRCDIDTGGPTWLYKPPHHKNSHRGKSRTITIGPKAQSLLREFFTANIDDHLFSPRRAVEEVRAARAAKRKTPLRPSQVAFNSKMRKAKPKRAAREQYSRLAHGTAVDRACDKAFPPPPPLAKRTGESAAKWWKRLTPEQRDEVKTWQKAHRWSPNQLRHSYATRVRKDHGLEAAQALLGHERADVTQVYAERNETLAASVAAKIG